MNKKIIVLSVGLLLSSAPVCAQRTLKLSQMSEAFTGGVPSAFSHVASVSVINAEVIGSRVAAAQFALNSGKYLSSAQLFEQVAPLQAVPQLPFAQRQALETKFANLDVAVRSTVGKHESYSDALRNGSPVLSAQALQVPHLQSMTQLLEVQRYMKEHKDHFPQIFELSEQGWLRTTDEMSTPQGNSAFLGVVEILVKEQTHSVPQVIVDQLVTLHASARNIATPEQLARQLQTWQSATELTTGGVPKLPTGTEGLSLRSNPEELWLATEIRLWQLTPNAQLPEILQNISVIR